MLRPEQMSKVSVTGSRTVMSDVIETIHELNLVHLSNYDGSWKGFDPGNPVDGANEASDKLVTVRSIESILDVDDEDAGPQRIVTDEALNSELEDIRAQVNTLDDKRNELQEELRTVEDRIDSMKPFAELGIDLDLLSGYDNLHVAVGEGNTDEIEQALAESDEIREFELFTEGRTVAVFAYPADHADEDVLDDALVGVDFASYEVPDARGSPEEYIKELKHERQKLESKLDGVKNELHDVKLDATGFLLAAEEKLTIEVQKAEAPLQFATTENAFVAEGWIPTEEYDRLERSLNETVGEHAEVDELRRADYEEGHEHTLTEEAEEVATTDGGHIVDDDEQPPVVQDNPGPVKPFEILVETINRPRYFEFDPSVILFLTFPIFFGFMIGDLGYGLMYLAIGYAIYSKTDSLALKSLGGIALWAGLFTAIFGVLYGEIFGLHILGEAIYGHAGPPIKKGLQPVEAEFASTWLVLSLLVGLAHLTLGYLFGFFEELSHGVKDAVLHKGSWILLMVGVWVWIFSKQLLGPKPEFLFTVFNGEPFALGFGGFPAGVGTVALVVAAVGLVLMIAGEVSHMGGPGALIGALESLKSLSDVISYTRIAAVLLAKAGMAFVINLLFFGAYEHHGEWHFMLSYGPSYVNSHYEGAEIIFSGLMHSGVAGVLVGLLILVVGHLLVLALGVTSAGLQAVRLEYVEFFGKFYQGGGEEYEPFGYDRTHTTQD